MVGWFLIAPLVVFGVACAETRERPTEAEWKLDWDQRRQLVPGVEELLLGGREFCDDLDSEFRVVLRELLPSPSKVLDEPVTEWTDRALSIVFECSDDESTLIEQLEALDVVAAEIDGGLGFDGE